MAKAPAGSRPEVHDRRESLPVDLKVGPDGGLYYLEYYLELSSGSVRVIRPSTGG
jgi:hypothetical protein